jgi:hypothetical protein
MADVIMGDSATDAVKQTLVINMMQRQLIAQSVLLGSIMDVSQFAVSGADEIEFPRMENMTVTKKVSGTAVDAVALGLATDKMLLEEHAVVQWLLEKKANKQAAINLELATLQNATKAHAKQVDVDIHAKLIAGVSTATPDHVIAFAGASFGRADIVAGLTLLDKQEFANENRYIAVNPDEHGALLNIVDFIDVSKYGSAMPVQNGELGKLFGATVLKSTVVASGRPLIYQKECAAIGFQLDPMYDSDKDLANLAMRYSVDQLYGIKVLQLGKGIVRLGSAT